MLINLSNHPVTEWDKRQLRLAEQKYGKVTDEPFPYIPPEADNKSVESIAWQMVEDICTTYNSKDIVIHIMGEQTFVYKCVSLFKGQGIPCIASTTERNVQLLGEGEKLSQFNFVNFREY